MKIEKGTPGYIKLQKLKLLVYTIVEFAVVIGLLLLGYTQTGTKANLFTVIAVVGCLPFAKMLVEFITIAPYKSVDPVKYREIEEKSELLVRAYDMIITSKEKVKPMPVDAMVISSNVVCGYSSYPKMDEVKAAQHLKELLKANHYDKVTVKIFKDYNAFLYRAEGMNNISSVNKSGTNKQENQIKAIILTTCM